MNDYSSIITKAFHSGDLHGALDSAIQSCVDLATQSGKKDLTFKEAKSIILALDRFGAMQIRHAVDCVATHTGVSRTTIYKHLTTRPFNNDIK